MYCTLLCVGGRHCVLFWAGDVNIGCVHHLQQAVHDPGRNVSNVSLEPTAWEGV